LNDVSADEINDVTPFKNSSFSKYNNTDSEVMIVSEPQNKIKKRVILLI